MNVTITLPPHVAAAIGDADTAAEIALAAITEEARRLAVNAVVDQVQAAATAAGAAFDTGAPPPEVPTLAQRVADVDQRVDRVPGLAVVAVEAALDQVTAITAGTPLDEAKAAAVAAVVEAIEAQ